MALNVQGSDSLYWKTGIDTTGLKKGSKKTKGIIAGLASSITKADVFFGLGASAALAFKKITKEAYKFSKDFESAMKEVQTISLAVQQNYDGVSDTIMRLSKGVPDMATKLTRAYYQIVSAGYDGAEGLRLLEASAKLAVAGVTDTFVAADTLTSIMNAYGKEAGTAMEISDKLFTTVKLGKITMEQLGGSLSMVTGLAAQAGLKFNELMGIVAKGTKTMKPEIMITGIKGMLTALIKPQQDALDLAKDLNLEFSIRAVKEKGFVEWLKEFNEATEGNIEAQSTLFANIRGLSGILAVATEEGGKLSDAIDAMGNSAGATEEAFAIMIATTENQLALLSNIMKAKMKPFGDYIMKIVNTIAKGINEKLTSTLKDAKKSIRDNRIEFETLAIILQNNSKDTDIYKDAQKKLNDKFGDTIGKLDDQIKKYGTLKIAIAEMRTELILQQQQLLVIEEHNELIKEAARLRHSAKREKLEEAKADATLKVLQEEKLKKQEKLNKLFEEIPKHLKNAAIIQEHIAKSKRLETTYAYKIAKKQLESITSREENKKLLADAVEKEEEIKQYAIDYADILANILKKKKKIVEITEEESEIINAAFKDIDLSPKELGDVFNRAFSEMVLNPEDIENVFNELFSDLDLKIPIFEDFTLDLSLVFDKAFEQITELSNSFWNTQYQQILYAIEKERHILNKSYQNKLIDLEEYNRRVDELNQEENQAHINMIQQIRGNEYSQKKQHLDDMSSALKTAREKDLITEEEYLQKKVELNLLYDELYIEQAQLFTDGMMSLSNNLTNHNIQNIQNELNAKIKDVNKSLLTEEEKQAKIANLKEEYAAKERKARAAQKPFLIAAAIANTAVGVTKALGATIPPFNFILAALVGAAGAVEIATIAAQKLNKGGEVNWGHIVKLSGGGEIQALRDGGIVIDQEAYNKTKIAKLSAYGSGLWMHALLKQSKFRALSDNQDGGEIQIGSDLNKDSVLAFLTKKEIVLNRESAQENRSFLLNLNKDKDYLYKNFVPRNAGGAMDRSPNIRIPSFPSFPSSMNISSNQLERLISAVKGQTLNQISKGSPNINVNIKSDLDMESFIIEFDKSRNRMVDRGYES